MKRILFASHSPTLTGAPQVIFNIVSNLDRARFEPLVLFPEDGPIIEKFKSAGISTTVVDIGDSHWGKLHIPMIEAICRTNAIDLVHANTILAFPFVTAAEKLNIPCLWYIHEMIDRDLPFQLDHPEFQLAVGKAFQIATVSKACEDEFLHYCESHGIAAPQLIVVPNGVAVSETFRLYEPGDPVELLSFGNLAPHKGYEFLIDALAIVNSPERRASLTIMGDGSLEYVSRLWKQAKRAGVESDVLFSTSELNVGERIERADIVVVPSIVESFGLAVAEAMAHAKPVVASDIRAVRELITDGENGLLAPPKDPTALANAILQFIDNPEYARRCGEKAREYVAANFTIQKQVTRLKEIYLSAPIRPTIDLDTTALKEAQEIYDLLSNALVLMNEKFHQMELEDREITQRFLRILTEMYEHVSERFAGTEDSVNREFTRVSDQMNQGFMLTHEEIARLSKDIAQAFEQIRLSVEDNRRVMEQRHTYVTEQVSNIVKDLRNLEDVVNGFLNKFPFRVLRKLKAVLRGNLPGN